MNKLSLQKKHLKLFQEARLSTESHLYELEAGCHALPAEARDCIHLSFPPQAEATRHVLEM